jgi:ribosomal protein S18 acetylase RimI-like enzyme
MTDVPAVRSYRDSDWSAVYDVCVRTGNGGQGAQGRYSTDDLLPDTFAGPYLTLRPQHAFVLDSGERAVGYIIGAASTIDYVADYREHWLPVLRTRYQEPPQPPVTDEQVRLDGMFHPERMLRPELAPYPAHLHINLLPGYQGSGHGRELMSRFMASVAVAGARWCHLGLRTANANARRFYDKLGWQPVEVEDPGPYTFMARQTGAR